MSTLDQIARVLLESYGPVFREHKVEVEVEVEVESGQSPRDWRVVVRAKDDWGRSHERRIDYGEKAMLADRYLGETLLPKVRKAFDGILRDSIDVPPFYVP